MTVLIPVVALRCPSDIFWHPSLGVHGNLLHGIAANAMVSRVRENDGGGAGTTSQSFSIRG